MARALGCALTDILDLSQTLNPFAPDVGPLVAAHLDSLHTYPDPREATRRLACAMGVEPGRLLITNGGSEAISLVRSVVGGGVRSEPEFALHPRATSGPTWRSDPQSPAGHLADDDEHNDVWDEAFYAMATGRWTAGRPGITVGSLTKLFACPGLRLGYVISDDIDRFAALQPRWSVSSLALAVLPDLLERAELPEWSRSIADARTSTVELFQNRGFEASAADAPWVLVEAPGRREQLATHGIVVRDCSSFGMPGTIRVAVTDDAGRRRLADALDAIGDTATDADLDPRPRPTQEGAA